MGLGNGEREGRGGEGREEGGGEEGRGDGMCPSITATIAGGVSVIVNVRPARPHLCFFVTALDFVWSRPWTVWVDWNTGHWGGSGGGVGPPIPQVGLRLVETISETVE